MKKIRFKFASVYSGGGFGSNGARNAGGTELFAVDLNDTAKKVFERNFPGVPFLQMNALTVTPDSLVKAGIPEANVRNMDILILSPTCTGISRANPYRDPNLPINQLLLDCPRIIKETRPKIAIIENVEGLCDPVMSPLLNMLRARCNKLKDYSFEYRVLNARDYGVPQNRKRFILICVRKDVGTAIFPEVTTVDYDALNVNRLFPDIVGFYPGGVKKKIMAKGSKEVIGKANKFTDANRPSGTNTATGGMMVMDLTTGLRPPSRQELIKFTGAEDMDFDNITDSELQFVTGNGIASPLMEAICNRLAAEYFDDHSE